MCFVKDKAYILIINNLKPYFIMKRFLFLILLFLETALYVIAQDEQKTIDKLEWELARLRICQQFFSNNKDYVINHKYESDLSVVNAIHDGFARLCQNYNRIIVDFDNRNIDKYPNVPSNHIIYSTAQKNGKTEINMYYERVSKRPQIKINGDTKAVSARPQVPQLIVIKDDIEIKELETQLNKIRNTKKLYQDLSGTLQHQINYNLVETADNAGDLLLKHVSIPQGDVLKEKAMEELKKNAGFENEKAIKNELADFVNSVVDGSEIIIELVPGGDIITNHYLWKLFKSTPEAGKGLGHLAASVNIYFRKSEYNNKVQELEAIERQIIKTIEEKRQRK